MWKEHFFEPIIKEAQRILRSEEEVSTPREKEREVIIEHSFAFIITGIRRCGKSTFLNQLLKKHKGYYLNLEDPRLDGFELADFQKVEKLMPQLYGEKGIYFFDEIQNIQKWETFIRYLIDRKEKVVITGSNASLLSRELGTRLTGRHLQYEIFPFSFKEFLKLFHKESGIASFEEFFTKGGFPEYLKMRQTGILQELFKDIIMRDIVARHTLRSTKVIQEMAL